MRPGLVHVCAMWVRVLVVLHVGLLGAPALGCYQCLVEVSTSLRLCWGHWLTQHKIRNLDSCFRTLDRVFNYNQKVIEAGRVGEGYSAQLKTILEEQILPMVEEFDRKLNDDTVYEERLQRAADRFIADASKLPRVSGCFPPCGFQASGAVYNCVTCQYDSCDLPLDCPVETLNVMEFSGTRMLCNVPFPLPDNTEVIWRYASQVETRKVDQFEEVTAGEDRLYSIPMARRWHQGTYQCELYAAQRSVVRLYYYLTVTPQLEVGHTELQEIFDLSVLPGGRMTPGPDGSPHSLLLPPPALLTTCLAAILLLLFLSLGLLYWCTAPLSMHEGDEA
ncbi:sperm acrosome membrane-associated protein 6 [Gadus morhua]|uniref:Ig-like domain-containing protein n=1 Tax=Gadus morhua TaxID=8049 RepID=A0A8C5CMQ1_GADMO|nr:sperm acrosome membrane-associated protein 6 [Gadus morhua]